MFLVVLALLLALPFVEVWVAVQVAEVIGAPLTLLLLLAMCAAGVVLLRREGTTVWRRANAEMAAGRVPTDQLLDGALVLIGGVSLMVPGFVTGVFGLLLMLPPVLISFPPDRSELDMEERESEPLIIKAEGGALPLTWLIDGTPVTSDPLRREIEWQPDGRGFAKLTVIDAKGHADRVTVRLR